MVIISIITSWPWKKKTENSRQSYISKFISNSWNLKQPSPRISSWTSNNNDKTNTAGLPPGFRSVTMAKSPPPTFRPPPPLSAPPVAPASPMTQRKISVNAPFKPSPQHSPNPPPGGFLPKRPVEKIEDAKITRFGEARMKSPAPPSTPPHQQRQFSPSFNGGSKLNGHTG